MNIVVANSNPIHAEVEKQLSARYPTTLLHTKDELNPKLLEKVNPAFVFFLHWSFIIPKEIYERFNCVVFHMTDLPYGRGGSPLQNLIVRGHTNTMLSAIKVEKGIDTGPVYLKKKLELDGTATDIFKKAGLIMKEMVDEIMTTRPTPVPQEGEAVLFKRRMPAESNLAEIDDLGTVYNYIRMLDADGYPNAFIETKHLRFEFTNASRDGDSVAASVKITTKK
jgi:methionyl-tRNA formyltransferase